MIEPKECFSIYKSIQFHFTQKKYDFFVSRGWHPAMNKMWSKKTPDERRLYEKAVYSVRSLNRQEIAQRVLANFTTKTPNIFIFESLDQDTHLEWRKRITSAHYIFELDLHAIVSQAGSIAKSLKPHANTSTPVLYSMLMTNKICMETFAWLVHFQPKIIDRMDQHFDELDGMWKVKKLVAQKYPSFFRRININEERLADILRRFIKQQSNSVIY